jgi:glycosyltransferase involved in cell wall biosynthesis
VTPRVAFLNENIGGHATMHLAIRDALADMASVDATFVDVPPPGLARKLVAAPVPGLAGLDLDLHPLRSQLAAAAVARRSIAGPARQADVLHVYSQNAALLSSDLLAGMPSVVSTDATNQQNAFRLPQRRPTWGTDLALVPTRAVERRVYDAATLVVGQSAWAAASLQAVYGVDRSRIRVIPFGITVRPATHVGNDGLPRITFVGRSMARKGGALLLEVWRRHLRDAAVLTLVTMEDVPPEPGLEVRRDVRPGDGKVEAILRATDIFAFPTELDTFGYAAIEAMAARVPVVATRTGGVPEVVADGETGVLVDPGDGGQLLDALQRLLRDAGARRAMGEAGRARVEAHFDALVTTRQLLEVLREAVELGPRRGARGELRGGTPPVAVVIPTHHRPDLLEEARQSVTTQRGATARVIVMEDVEGAGAAVTRNRGLAAATEDYVLFLDDDDVLAPGALQALMHAAVVTGAAVVAGQRLVFDERGLLAQQPVYSHRVRRSRVGPMWRELDASDDLVTSRFLFRRDALVEVGGFAEGLTFAEDRELLWRLASRGHAWVVIPDVVLGSRSHPGSGRYPEGEERAAALAPSDAARAGAAAIGPEVARRLQAWDAVWLARRSGNSASRSAGVMVRAVRLDPSLLTSPLFRNELLRRLIQAVPGAVPLVRGLSRRGAGAPPRWLPVSVE